MTENDMNQTIDTLTPTLVEKLKALGKLGEEIEHPPKEASSLWILGALSPVSGIVRDIETIERALSLMIREVY